jgi:hypothetical protein
MSLALLAGVMTKFTSSTASSRDVLARLRAALGVAAALTFGLVAGACDVDDIDTRDGAAAFAADLEDIDLADAEPGPVDAFLVGSFAADGLGQASDDVDSCDAELEDSCDEPSAEKHTITNCYCGLYGGSPLYVGVSCAGYASVATCCAEKCGELKNALDSQE